MNRRDRTLTPLINAIKLNDIATTKSLLATFRQQAITSPLALNTASTHGRTEIMTLLLDAGADIEAVDDDGQTAYHHAARSLQLRSLKLLIERGANVGKVRRRGESLLVIATRAEVYEQSVCCDTCTA
jgi:ankyrin repeat protein